MAFSDNLRSHSWPWPWPCLCMSLAFVLALVLALTLLVFSTSLGELRLLGVFNKYLILNTTMAPTECSHCSGTIHSSQASMRTSLPKYATHRTGSRFSKGSSIRCVYKCLRQAALIYLSELCIPVSTFTGRSHLRLPAK